MAVRKAKQDPAVEAAIAAGRRHRAEQARMEEQLRTERASALAKPIITTVRPDGSRWTFTPAVGADPDAVAAVIAKLNAIKPHKNPRPHKARTMAQYAASVARPLPEVGVTVDNSPKAWRKYAWGVSDVYYRLPDDADEGAPREIADRIADAQAEYAGCVESEVRFVDAITEDPTPTEIAAAFDRAERTNAAKAHLDGLRAVAAADDHADHTRDLDASDRAALDLPPVRPFRGAGAYSRRQRIAVINTLPEVA